jgi:protein O-mannosyl-transferase
MEMRTLSAPAAIILIILIGAAALGRVAKFDFVNFDDYETVSENPQLRPPTSRSFKDFWTRPQMDLYIPVTYTLWAFVADGAVKTEALDPKNPSGAPLVASLDARVFHTLNLALHLAAGAIVFLLLRDLSGSPHSAAVIVPRANSAKDLGALAGAILFVIHPVQVEPVAWVSGMKDVLMGLLALAAIWQYVRLARDDASNSLVPPGEWWGRYLLASVLFALAMLSKPTAIVTPLIAIVLDRVMIGRSWRKVLSWTWPWFVMAAPIAVITKLAQPAPAAHADAPAIWLRPLIAADAIAFYLYKLVFPAQLAFDYGRRPAVVIQHGWIWRTWVAPAAIAGVLIVFRKRFRAGIAGGLLFVVALLPLLGLVPFDFQSYSTVADHYLYLAMLGPALVLAWVVSRRENTFALLAVTAVVLLALGVRTFDQTPHWKNSAALNRRALEVNPQSFAAYYGLAGVAMEAKDYGQAAELCRLAIQLNPAYARAYLTRADAFRLAGNITAAMADYRKTVELLPDNAPALNNLGSLLAERGKVIEGIELTVRAVKADPDLLDARLNLARMYLATAQLGAARNQIDEVLARDPTHAAALDLRAQLP